MIIIGILVKLTSKGPLFYKQERVGLDDQKFMMLKFRSMKDRFRSKRSSNDYKR